MEQRLSQTPLGRQRGISPWSLVCVLACASAAGCQGGGSPSSLAILVSGDTSGWITPCGCASNQSGGLPRRADLLRRMRKEAPVLALDVGGVPGGTSPYDRLKFEAILRGERAMQVEAHNIGRAEAMLGAETLRNLRRRFGVTWLSANVSDRAGEPIGEPVRLVEASGRRIAIVGVLDPAFAAEELSVGPVVPSVLAALEAVSGRYDSLILLAYLEDELLRETAAMLPEVDVVIGGPTGQPIPPTHLGPTLLASATNKGKFVVRLDAPAQARGWQAEIVELDETFGDDPGQIKNLNRYYEELARRRFTAAETLFLPPGPPVAGGEVAGSERCEKCHARQHAAWLDSTHAHAWNSLEKKSAHVDPDCQRCHSTGYGMPGGYDGLKTEAERTGVGCESCHGPSLAHVLEPKVSTAWAEGAADSCLGCHDRENSPNFDYGDYWPKIEHGADSTDRASGEAK